MGIGITDAWAAAVAATVEARARAIKAELRVISFMF
jgi:hypothetical protein